MDEEKIIEVLPACRLNVAEDLKLHIQVQREKISRFYRQNPYAFFEDFGSMCGFDLIFGGGEWDDDDYDDYGPYEFGPEDLEDDYTECYPGIHIDTKEYLDKRKRIRENGGLVSQRFVNGMEVDPIDGKPLKKGHKRRGGKQHRKRYKNKAPRYEGNSTKRQTRYVYDDWEADHPRPDGFDDVMDMRDSLRKPKKIVFYRTLNDPEDTYEWDNLAEFNEWLEEERIEVKGNDAYEIVYNDETHCCLDPETSGKVLFVDRTYVDLVWQLTGGDSDLLDQYSKQSIRL